MSTAASASQMSEAAELFASDLMRTVDRLRSIGLARLAASFSPEPTRADAAFDLIASLAQRAAACEGIAPIPVPRLSDAALGDQCAVIGRDLLVSARNRGEAEVLLQSAADLRELRRRI